MLSVDILQAAVFLELLYGNKLDSRSQPFGEKYLIDLSSMPLFVTGKKCLFGLDSKTIFVCGPKGLYHMRIMLCDKNWMEQRAN